MFKKIGIIAITLFSFYYTDKIASLVLQNNELYQEIDEKKDAYEVLKYDAKITNNYIIPGLNGTKVNVKNSYFNMKEINTFNEFYLKYDDVIPSISLKDNKDKIIKQGNPVKKSIALITYYDKNIIDYLKDYNFSVLINLEEYQNNVTYEQINNDFFNYKKLETLLNKHNYNKNICMINKTNMEFCINNQKYLIEPTKVLNNSTYLSIKDNINSGDIILIDKNTKLSNIEVILKSIKYKDYKINNISNHISEVR